MYIKYIQYVIQGDIIQAAKIKDQSPFLIRNITKIERSVAHWQHFLKTSLKCIHNSVTTTTSCKPEIGP